MCVIGVCNRFGKMSENLSRGGGVESQCTVCRTTSAAWRRRKRGCVCRNHVHAGWSLRVFVMRRASRSSLRSLRSDTVRRTDGPAQPATLVLKYVLSLRQHDDRYDVLVVTTGAETVRHGYCSDLDGPTSNSRKKTPQQ